MKTYKITIQGQTYEVQVQEVHSTMPEAEEAKQPRPASRVQETPRQEKAPATARKTAAAEQESPGGKGQVTAPMPGMVLEVKVEQGQQVQDGEVLLLLEAMKMENAIKANSTGQVKEIRVQEGDSVNTGDLLLIVE
ncbi:MAG: biotin/lipoyl-containing protein [Desulfohalobiaceae bacterium]